MLTQQIITKKQFFIIYGLFFCLFVLSINGFISGVAGCLFFLGVFFCQYLLIRKYFEFQEGNFQNCGLLAFSTASGYCVVSLSVLYYLVGIANPVLSIWAGLSYCLSLFFLKKFDHLEIPIERFKTFLIDSFNNLNGRDLIIIVFSLYLFSTFFNNPILNGSPTPWVNSDWLTFIIFFLISFCFVNKILKRDANMAFISGLYLFIVISVIAIKYVLSFGYDTLLHQASLEYINLNGRIEPLTPFYIGQYVLEVLAHKATGFSFVVIERWLVPLFFWLVTLLSGFYTVKNLKLSKSAVGLVPLAVLLLLPSFFTYTSPFAFSLTWIYLAAIGLWFYISTKRPENYYLALTASLMAFFIHPFVCLNFLAALVCVRFYLNKKVKTGSFLLLLIGSAMAVPLFFLVYNWVRGQEVFLKDPLYYLNYFLALFGDPAWYSLTHYSLGNYLVYLFEKFHLILFGLVSIIWLAFDKINRRSNIFLFITALGVTFAAWFFVSAIEVEGFGYGDQINYAYRLVGIAQWLLWVFIFLALEKAVAWLALRKRILNFLGAALLATLLTLSFYLTYPRNDEIVRANVNNIRAVDYQAIDYIYQKEKGKDGYLVFANQVFGAAAIQKYGYNPYYETPWGNVFYYSVPMSGELNQRYERIMNSQEFDRRLINEILEQTGTARAYFIITDYWPLLEKAYDQMKDQAAAYINIEQQEIEIFVFDYQY